jgi:hypothetical protein
VPEAGNVTVESETSIVIDAASRVTVESVAAIDPEIVTAVVIADTSNDCGGIFTVQLISGVLHALSITAVETIATFANKCIADLLGWMDHLAPFIRRLLGDTAGRSYLPLLAFKVKRDALFEGLPMPS